MLISCIPVLLLLIPVSFNKSHSMSDRIYIAKTTFSETSLRNTLMAFEPPKGLTVVSFIQFYSFFSVGIKRVTLFIQRTVTVRLLVSKQTTEGENEI